LERIHLAEIVRGARAESRRRQTFEMLLARERREDRRGSDRDVSVVRESVAALRDVEGAELSPRATA
jgi:hypothetical protein